MVRGLLLREAGLSHNRSTFVSAIGFPAHEGENEPVGRQEAEEGEERAEGGNGGSQRMCNARLTHCHHDNRHHFTGAALRMPVWAEVT